MLEVKYIDIGRLRPWEDNPRLNDHAVDAVAESIRSFGFNVPILCDQNFTIVAGHTRWKTAQKLGLEVVPVITVEMTDAKRRAFAIADNKTAEIADWDFPKLREVLEELCSEDIDIRSMGFSNEELRRFIQNGDEEENMLPEVNETSSVTQPGDLYTLGNHRLLCGDSRDRDSIKKLTEDQVMDHIFGGLLTLTKGNIHIGRNIRSILKICAGLFRTVMISLKQAAFVFGTSRMGAALIMTM
jgi:hypothetical protein